MTTFGQEQIKIQGKGSFFAISSILSIAIFFEVVIGLQSHAEQNLYNILSVFDNETFQSSKTFQYIWYATFTYLLH